MKTGFCLRFFLCAFSLFFFSLTGLSAETEGVVTANRLNVRVRPSTKFTVVATLLRGDRVKIARELAGWYEIEAPQKSSVWIAKPFVNKEGEIIREVKLRSGPSIAYAFYGTIAPGVKVNIIDDKREHWVKILPPKGLTAWTSSKYISTKPEDVINPDKLLSRKDNDELAKLSESSHSIGVNIKPEKREDSAQTDSSASPETPTETTSAEAEAAAPRDYKAEEAKLPFVEGEEETVEEQGIIMPLQADAVYVTHALVKEVGDQYFPICYLHSTQDLKKWTDYKVKLKGRRRWVKGWKQPIIEVEEVKAVVE